MPLLKNRKRSILLYIFLLALLSSTNNINFKNLKNFFEVKLINIKGIENLNKSILINELSVFEKKIFFSLIKKV